MQLLLVPLKPHVACEQIERALRENRLRLYRDGTVVLLSDIRTHLHVVAEQEADGRWLCTIVSDEPARVRVIEVDDSEPIQRVTVAFPAPSVWEVDAEGLEELLPGGTARVQRWTDAVAREIWLLRYNGSPLLENLEQLYAHMAAHLKRKEIALPTNMKRFRRRIRDLLGVPD